MLGTCSACGESLLLLPSRGSPQSCLGPQALSSPGGFYREGYKWQVMVLSTLQEPVTGASHPVPPPQVPNLDRILLVLREHLKFGLRGLIGSLSA